MLSNIPYDEMPEKIEELARDVERLENNWNELKEQLTNYINTLENQKDDVEGLDIFEEHALTILEEIVDKMQEIESRK